ncbi:MAG: META domain-containing protein [Muribaculaceae bacterium]
MKKRIVIAMLVSATMLTGCSLFQKNVTTGTEVEGKEIPIEEDVVPEETDNTTSNETTSGTEIAKHYRKIAGEWTIVAVGNHKIDKDEMPYLVFSAKDKCIYGNNSCNVINGGFTMGEGKTITFTNIISTMMACPDMKTESAINKAIGDACTYSYSTIDGIVHLSIYDKNGNRVLKLRKHNLSAINGAWTVKEINGESFGKNGVKITIDTDQLKLHGNSGCNIINGCIVLDPKKKNAIQFQDIASTRMMCPEINLETKLLVALESVEYFSVEKSSEVILLDNKMKKIIVLKRLNLEQ